MFRIIFALILLLSTCIYSNALRVKNKVAVFSELDKITGKSSSFKVKIGDVYHLGNLDIFPKVCYSSIGEDVKGPSVYVVVTENLKNKPSNTIFSGWMFASSPALNCIDHPVYDIWLTGAEEPEIKEENVSPPDTKMLVPDTTNSSDDQNTSSVEDLDNSSTEDDVTDNSVTQDDFQSDDFDEN